MPEPADFQRLLHLLTEKKVKFIVVGGMAMVSHGSAFVTADLDICYDPMSISKLWLKHFGLSGPIFAARRQACRSASTDPH